MFLTKSFLTQYISLILIILAFSAFSYSKRYIPVVAEESQVQELIETPMMHSVLEYRDLFLANSGSINQNTAWALSELMWSQNVNLEIELPLSGTNTELGFLRAEELLKYFVETGLPLNAFEIFLTTDEKLKTFDAFDGAHTSSKVDSGSPASLQEATLQESTLQALVRLKPSVPIEGE